MFSTVELILYSLIFAYSRLNIKQKSINVKFRAVFRAKNQWKGIMITFFTIKTSHYFHVMHIFSLSELHIIIIIFLIFSWTDFMFALNINFRKYILAFNLGLNWNKLDFTSKARNHFSVILRNNTFVKIKICIYFITSTHIMIA
jgi:hypothetical protein